MSQSHHRACAERLQLAFDLFETGLQMKRLQLRRSHPDESEEQIERRLEKWLLTRPGAEHGDAEGRPVDPGRFRS